MKSLGLFLTVVAFASAAAAPAPAQAGAEPLPAQYSFNDLYQLTVGHPPSGLVQPAATEAALRVAVVEGAVAEPRFTVRQLPAPERWLLVLAGLALAAWVAHRRLSYL